MEDYKELRAWAEEACQGLALEKERITEKLNQQQKMLMILDEFCSLCEENVSLRQQLEEGREQRAELEMKLMEMSKLSAGMAKKASEENLLRALRTYVNRSKRKTADKRAFAKSATLEIANANGLNLPDDLRAAIESLDDEQIEAKVVTVNGNYTDVHGNGEVELK